MSKVHLTWGLRILSLANVGFLVASIAYDASLLTILGFLASGVGFLGASTAAEEKETRWGRISLGTALAFLGMVPFLLENFVPFQFSIYVMPLLGYMIGLLAFTAATFAASKRGDLQGATRLVAFAGAGLLLIAALFWIPTDGYYQNWWWTPGNVLTLIGAGAILYALVRATPAADAVQ